MLPVSNPYTTLFIDRDGVINKRKVGGYVDHWEEFHYLNKSDEALVKLSRLFKHLIVVTNQQGIGKGLTLLSKVKNIHRFLLDDVARKGGHLSGVFLCPHLKTDHCRCRKPFTAMAIQAQKYIPTIDFEQSIMIGDSRSDMQFGKAIGARTVLVDGKNEEAIPSMLYDLKVDSLMQFYEKLNTEILAIQKKVVTEQASPKTTYTRREARARLGSIFKKG